MRRFFRSRLRGWQNASQRHSLSLCATLKRGQTKTTETPLFLAQKIDQPRSASETAFQYPQLDRDGYIRVLVLEAAPTTDAPLKGSLVHLRVDDTPSYDAISYTWGGSESPESLHLTGGLLKITENLSQALRRFRLAYKPRSLWADAVCINQQDDVEKGHQVAMMSKIYRNATTVLIWLGEETPEIETAIRFLDNLAETKSWEATEQAVDINLWFSPPTLAGDPQEGARVLAQAKENHIHKLYGRDWFTRLWIVQEVALAKSAILHCGSRELYWNRFTKSMTYLKGASNTLHVALEEMVAFDRAWNIIDIDQHWQNVQMGGFVVSNYHHFGVYLYRLRQQKCTDDRDRVFALLGLKASYIPVDIEPDYTKSPFEIYKELALELPRSGELNLLYAAGIWQRDWWSDHVHGSTKEENDEMEATQNQKTIFKPASVTKFIVEPSLDTLPSWVPWFSYSDMPHVLPWANIHGLKGFSARSGDMIQKIVTIPNNPNYLFAKVALLGKIIYPFALGAFNKALGYKLNIQHLAMSMWMCRTLFDVKFPAKEYCTGEELDLVFARTIVADGSGLVFRSYFGSPADAETRDRTFLELWKLYEKLCISPDGEVHKKEVVRYGSMHDKDDENRIVGSFREPYGRLDEYAKRDYITDLDFYESFSPDGKRAWEYHQCLREAMEIHTFFITDDNFVGLAPIVATSGDQVALIDSLRTPFLLRPVRVNNEYSGYAVVGPCYLHGVMYGETKPGGKLEKESKMLPLV
jgi:hypothetical protein